MALSKSLKRKVDSEIRVYKEEWTADYTFILSGFISAKLLCLICNQVVFDHKECDETLCSGLGIGHNTVLKEPT